MSNSKTYERDPLYVVEPLIINSTKKFIGKLLVWGSFSLMLLLAIVQYLKIIQQKMMEILNLSTTIIFQE